MSAADIAAALGDARREGRAWRCRCPLHHGSSLVIRDGDSGRILATCWAGCNRLDVLGELRRLGLLDRHSGRRDVQHWQGQHRSYVRDDDGGRTARARAIWDGAAPAVGSFVEPYLAGRGITLPPPLTLRYAPALRRLDGSHGPAMVARVDGADGALIGVHRTWLVRDADGIWRRRDRAALGLIGGGAVRLAMPRPGEWLVAGEGLETVMAVMQACAMPGWAALSAGGLRALVLPPEMERVLVAADNDVNGVGQRAAHDAADRWLAEGRRVRIAIPPERGKDFNDLLAAGASTAAEARHVA